jgi:hypothetical protein
MPTLETAMSQQPLIGSSSKLKLNLGRPYKTKNASNEDDL